ncbi:tetratricopeptide repeat protein [Mesorhizobium xinjiangense]|uniref:tetratricopeptide repeat protein n=1 Tax=Mesorhizobium xinjiangense TaxID=2678685 RepID=UPI0012ED7480|nr:tetratricopeptide repeat protein [Mesorhizobium xinjiangense]
MIGALTAFPRRLAAREVEDRGAHLRHGVTRQTTHVVLGRGLLARDGDTAIEERVERERGAGKRLLSENGFLRLLGLRRPPAAPALTRASLIEQSGLAERDVELLSLFDAFENDGEPYSFRDVILAKKYAGLIAGGASWGAIARSVHRAPAPVTALTALALETEGRDAIYARRGDALSELDGQMLLPIERPDEREPDALFDEAEEAESEGRFEEAADLYEKCLALDPKDSVAAYNRANCLAAMGHMAEARRSFLITLKLDPAFVEAWFNLADLVRQSGHTQAARSYLSKAVTLDPDYADAVYNLATLEFDAGKLAEARRWWVRYLELDPNSAWARNAARGVQYADLQLARRNAG